MNTQFCSKCQKDKPISQFLHSGRNKWCRDCRIEYGSKYRQIQRETYSSHSTTGIRPEFESTILTDDEMERECKNYQRPESKGANALCEFTKTFEKLCKLKRFPKSDTSEAGVWPAGLISYKHQEAQYLKT